MKEGAYLVNISGGCVTNTVLGLKSRCYLCYNIGDDKRGRLYANEIAERSNINRIESTSSGCTWAVVTFISDIDDNTTKTCLYNHGCSNDLYLNPQLRQTLTSDPILYISLFSFFGGRPDNVFEIMECARDQKSEIILDVGGVRSLERSKLQKLLSYSTGILANLGEIKSIEEKIGVDINELSKKLWVIIKQGGGPTEMYYLGGKVIEVKPKECYNPVNFIGAGDAFASGLLDTLGVSDNFEKAIENGNQRALGVINKESFH